MVVTLVSLMVDPWDLMEIQLFLKQLIINKKVTEQHLSRNTNYKNVGWGVEAHKIMNNGWGPYGRDSFHPTYGQRNS